MLSLLKLYVHFFKPSDNTSVGVVFLVPQINGSRTLKTPEALIDTVAYHYYIVSGTADLQLGINYACEIDVTSLVFLNNGSDNIESAFRIVTLANFGNIIFIASVNRENMCGFDNIS